MARGTERAVLVAPEVPPELVAAWSEGWEDWFGPARVPLPRAPEKRHLALVSCPLGTLAAKREAPRGWRRSLAALGARELRSAQAFRRAHALLGCGLATPEPLAVLARRELGDCEAVLLTRYVEGRGPWEHLRAGGGLDALIAALARELARLHAAGFRHRDLKVSNLLVTGSATEPRIVWTDLDGLRRIGSVPPLLRARDLARLSMSFESAEARAAGVRAEHWPALVAAYLEAAGGRAPTADELGRYLARTRRWRERSIRRHLAHGRPVL